jgi:hypothetical protein
MSFLVGFGAHARADTLMPFKHSRFLIENGVPHPLAEPADIKSLPAPKQLFAETGSAIESEGKVSLRKKRDLRKAIALVRELAAHPSLADAVLGQDYRITYTATWGFEDRYLDRAADRFLAREEAGLRYREVPASGEPGQINSKPPGATHSGPNDIITTRAEYKLNVGPNPDIAAIARSENPDSPMAWLQDLGQDPAQFIEPSAQVPDKRGRFELAKVERNSKGEIERLPDGQEQVRALAEISLDHVFAGRSLVPGETGKRVTFFGMEIDIAHSPIVGRDDKTAGMGVVVARDWQAPHKPSDAADPSFYSDPGVKEVHGVIARLMQHLGDHGVRYRPAVPKYTETLLRLGAIKPVNDRQRLVMSRTGWLGGRKGGRR